MNNCEPTPPTFGNIYTCVISCTVQEKSRNHQEISNLEDTENNEHTLRCGKVKYISVLPEHVDFFNTRNRLDVQLLQCTLELLIILCGRFRLWNHLATGSSLTACMHRSEPRKSIWSALAMIGTEKNASGFEERNKD